MKTHFHSASRTAAWVFVADAGYNKDFITAQGISDAFRDAELCAAALDQAFSGTRRFENALVEYQSTRDAHVRAMYELTADFASSEPASAELQQVLAAVHGTRRRWTTSRESSPG